MIKELSKRFTEVIEVLQYLSYEEYDKIPRDIIEYIMKHKDSNYAWKYDTSKELYEQNLPKETISILAYINIEFLVNDAQKKYLKKVYRLNDIASNIE